MVSTEVFGSVKKMKLKGKSDKADVFVVENVMW